MKALEVAQDPSHRLVSQNSGQCMNFLLLSLGDLFSNWAISDFSLNINQFKVEIIIQFQFEMAFGMITVGIFWGTLFYKLKTTPYNQQQTMLTHSTQLAKRMAKDSLTALWSRYISRKNKQKEQEKQLEESSFSAYEPQVITSFRNSQSMVEVQKQHKKIKKAKKMEKLNQRMKQMKKKYYKGILGKCKGNQQNGPQRKQRSKEAKQTTEKAPLESDLESEYFNKSYMEQLQLSLECEKNGGMILQAMEDLEKKSQHTYNPFKSK